MKTAAKLLTPSDAARRLGVSVKALRVYEERGLLRPLRSAAGWRTYGPDEITRGRDIVELRRLGLSLNEIARVLGGDAPVFERALGLHESMLESRVRELSETVRRVRSLRAELAHKTLSVAAAVSHVRQMSDTIDLAIDLPWPWGGERFELRGLRNLTHVVGSLGSGKTRLAMSIAEAIPGAAFIGTERAEAGVDATEARLDADQRLKLRVCSAFAALIDLGATKSAPLLALLTAIEADGATAHVVDMLEEGLDAATQEALICFLRRRAPTAKPLIFLTRSSAILDLEAVTEHEAIIFCPANHSPPFFVAPYRGAAGYEALAMCLASPDVRARVARPAANRSARVRREARST